MTFTMQCGHRAMNFDYDEEAVLGVLESNEVKTPAGSKEELVEMALAHPIGCGPLETLIKPGETVAIIISDITRNWQSMDVYVPILVKHLNAMGVRDQDISIISATGTHREQSEAEHIALVGADINERIGVLDHRCTDLEQLTYMGTTSYGTPVMVGSRAVAQDHIIITGGVVYHFLAGFGGGRKAVLPGICGRETIMTHHAHALNKGMGSGSNPAVCSGNISPSNPFHMDMMEAAAMVRPTFLFNVVVDSDFNLLQCFAGDYVEAHRAACDLVDAKDGVIIPELAEVVIATAGGFPKDINFYQTSKTFFNAFAAAKNGGTIIVVSACNEGLGSPELEHILCDFDNMKDREVAVRADFSIGAFVGFQAAEVAEHYRFILVTEMEAAPFKNSKIEVARTIDDALEMVYQKEGRRDLKAILMPHGANTLPKRV